MTENLTIPDGMDSGAVNLARAIRKQESGGDYTKYGDSGSSYGAYQWNNQPNGKSVALKKGELPSNFKNWATEVGLDPNDFSPKNQDMVAYRKIKSLKDAGNNVVDIASIWNGGDAKRQDPNYVTPSGLPSQKKGVYDVPAYAKAVNDNYQALKDKSQGMPNIQPQKGEGFLSSILSSVTDPISQLGGSVMSGINTLTGGALQQNAPVTALDTTNHNVTGLTGNKVDTFGYRNGQELSGGDTSKQVAGNALQNVATVGLGGIGKIAETAGIGAKALQGAKVGARLGAMQGAGNTLEQGGNIQDTLTSGAIGGGVGALTGGVMGGTGGLLSKLPSRLTQDAFKGVTPDTANYALENKKLGSISKMISDSKNTMTDLGNQLENHLSQADNFGKSIDGKDVFTNAIKGDPNIPNSGLGDSGYTQSQLAKVIKGLVKNSGALVDELFKPNGDLSLVDANRLRKAIGERINWNGLDTPSVASSKQVGSQVYFALSNLIKQKAPETATVFDQFSKEIPLRNALLKMQQKGGVLGGNLTMKDIVLAILGNSAAGIPGLLGVAGYHAASTPVGQFAGAKLLQGASNLIGNKAYLTAGLLGKSLQTKEKTPTK